jgi:phosphoribosylformylglycinamidine cyclo-ligase
MRNLGIGIWSTGGETADVGDLVKTIIVDSTVNCRMKRSEVIDNGQIRDGDVIVGLSSYGKASYEKEYNGGMGSNGLTSARHDLLHNIYREKYQESLDPAMPADLSYTGPFKVSDPSGVPGVDIGKLILSPTRTYAPVVVEILKQHRKEIHGMVHCSGGGQTKVLHFVENLKIVKDNLFDIPPLFRMIQKASGTSWKEMYKVFNMGHRMEIYLPEKLAGDIIRISSDFHIDARIIGHCEIAEGKKLVISTKEAGNLVYE